MNKIIEENEYVYFKKYGISLQKCWDELPESVKTRGISKMNSIIETIGTEDLGFKSEDILRIFIGYRGCVGLKSILKNALSTTSIVIWEPDEVVFLAGCVTENISDYIKDDRIGLIFGREELGIENILRERIGDHNINHRNIMGYGEYLDTNNKDVILFSEIFRKVAGEIKTGGNARKKFHQLPTENILYALKKLNNNSIIEQLFEKMSLRDIPVIIVAAGPSLEKNCNELTKAKGKAIIIAVTHAMKILKNNNIVPDFIAVTDATATDYMYFDEKHEYPAICSVFASRDFQREFDGHLIYHGFELYDGIYLPQRTKIKLNARIDTGSVATDVFSLFLSAGFRTFILVGQDLAYDERGYTHAGKEIEDEPIEKDVDDIWIEGINGESVRTRNDWIHFRDTYENMLKLFSDVNLIDATEGGALIHGTQILMLKDAVAEYCIKEYPVSDWISKVEKGDRKEIEEIKTWFEEAEKNCEDTEIWLEEAIALNSLIRNKWNDQNLWDNEFKASCKRYDVLYNTIINGTRSILLRYYCSAIIQQYIEDALVLEGDENIERRMRMEYELMTAMKSKAEELLEYIRSLQKED